MPWTACPKGQYKALADLQSRIDDASPGTYYASYKNWQKDGGPSEPEVIGLYFSTEEVRAAIDAGCHPKDQGRVLEADYDAFATFAAADPTPIGELLPSFFGESAGEAERYRDDRLKKLNGVVILYNDGNIYVIRPFILNRYRFDANDAVWGPVLAELQRVADFTGERIFNIDLAAQFRMGGDDGFFGRKPSVPGVVIRGGA